MGSNWHKDIEEVAKELGSAIMSQVYSNARYEVQNDFNNELVDYVANGTGHDRLAATVFVEVSLDSYDDLDVNQYVEPAYVAGVYTSKSSYHPGYEGWKVVKKFKTMSKDEFWEMRESGEDADHGTYGGVDAEWMTNNFWDGIVYCTNGWPLGNAEFLSVFVTKETPASSVVENYIHEYQMSNRYIKHIRKELNKIIK